VGVRRNNCGICSTAIASIYAKARLLADDLADAGVLTRCARDLLRLGLCGLRVRDQIVTYVRLLQNANAVRPELISRKAEMLAQTTRKIF
jgi:hypothetical protein